MKGVLVGIVRMIFWTSKGEIGKWKLTEEEELFLGKACSVGSIHKMDCENEVAPIICRNSAYFVLKLELLLTMLSKFEGEAAFWWVACLTHQVSWSIYSLITSLIGLALYMIWYIQYSWLLVVEWGRTKYWNRWSKWWEVCWRGFQLPQVKFDRDEVGRDVLRIGSCSINI